MTPPPGDMVNSSRMLVVDISFVNEMSLGRESCRINFILADLGLDRVRAWWAYAAWFHRRVYSRGRDDGPSGASMRDVYCVFAGVIVGLGGAYGRTMGELMDRLLWMMVESEENGRPL